MRFHTSPVLFYLLLFLAFNRLIAESYTCSIESHPASVIHNVSTIFGDYTEVKEDLSVSGPDNLVLSRLYTSRKLPCPTNFGSWFLRPEGIFQVEQSESEFYITHEGKFKLTHIFVGTPDGSILKFTGWKNETNLEVISDFYVDTEEEFLGTANTAKGEPSHWTNLNNYKMIFDPKNNSYELLFPNGRKSLFKFNESTLTYCLEQERLPSGNIVYSNYDSQGRILKVWILCENDEVEISWISFEYNSLIKVTSSDQKQVEYNIETNPYGQSVLNQVNTAEGNRIKYEYEIRNDYSLLTKKQISSEPTISISYERKPENRVQSISEFAGINELATTSFKYYVNPDESGYTEVVNSIGAKKICSFNEDYQLTAVEDYLEGSLYRKESLTWGEERFSGNLLSKSIEDRSGNLYYHKTYRYDDENRILEEREYGNFTGVSPEPLVLDSRNIPSGECHSLKYCYSFENGIDIVFQGDQKGTGIRYEYKEGTGYLLAKLALKEGSIKSRTFFEYKNGSLASIIKDDGSNKNKNLISGYGVSQRLTTNITPKESIPNYGAPETIEEYCWSVNGQKDSLIRKKVNSFDSFGHILSQEMYGSDSQLCYKLNWEYNSQGQVANKTDPLGRKTTYLYNDSGRLSQKVKENKVWMFTYDPYGNLTSLTESSSSGKSFETHFQYDSQGNKIKEVDFKGQITSFTYDEFNRLTSVSYPDLLIDSYGVVSPIYSYEYDIFDNQILVTGSNGFQMKRSYTIHGKPSYIQYADGKEEFFEYSISGALRVHKQKNGIEKLFSYDFQGQITQLESYFSGDRYPYQKEFYEYRGFNLSSKSTSSGGMAEDYQYDHLGRLSRILVSTKNACNQSNSKNKTEFYYDNLGRLEKTKKWKDKSTYSLYLNEYDILGRIVHESIENELGERLFQKEYAYNTEGEITQLIGYPNSQHSILAQYEYDDFNRLVQKKDALGALTQIEYNDYNIDSNGQHSILRKTIDPEGDQTEETLDKVGNLTHFLIRDRFGAILCEENYSYDFLGNRVKEESSLGFEYANAFSFLAGGELAKTQIGIGETSPEIENSYNIFGQVTEKKVSGFKKPISYTYKGRELASITFEDCSTEKKYSFRWDQNHNPIETKLGNKQKVHSGYNSQGALLKEKYQDTYGEYSLFLEYDGEGNITQLTLPNGSHIQYDYTGPFIQKVTRLSKNNEEKYSHCIYERDLLGAPLQELLVGKLGTQQISYDALGRKTELKNDFLNDEIINYDGNGNITARVLLNGKKNLDYFYEFDGLDQLTSEEGLISGEYSYNPLRNRITYNQADLEVNPLNQICSVKDTEYTYDAAGNISEEENPDTSITYQYDQLGRLVKCMNKEGISIKNTYDPFGRRLTKIVEQNTAVIAIYRYFYLGFYELGCVDENGEIVQLRIPDDPNKLDESKIIAVEFDDQYYGVISDIQGNVAALLDPNRRKIRESYFYSAFGEESILNAKGREISSCNVKNPWRYQSKYHDSEAELVYFGQRYYKPKIGRWISPDPALSIDGLNLYTYAHNNPLKYKDFLGLSAKNCGCIQHDHPGFHNRPQGCICVCGRRGSEIKSTFCGIAHGLVDVACDFMEDLDAVAFYGELYSTKLLMRQEKKQARIQAFRVSQQSRYSKIEQSIQNALAISADDSTYNSYRYSSRTGIEMGLLVAGGYHIVQRALLSPVFASRSFGKLKTKKLNKVISEIDLFLEGKGRIITNKKGDLILMNNNKKIRFDVKNSHGCRPHFHLEKKNSRGRWIDAGTQHRYYFKEM